MIDRPIKRLFSPLVVIACLLASSINAQLLRHPIGHKLEAQKNINARALVRTFDTLSLPFWDDFSFVSITPSEKLWYTGDDVYVNSSLGINPISLNVATFDGSNGQGLAYDEGSVSPQITDVLSSKPINLSGLDESDNVVLSFYWQKGGHGYPPGTESEFTVSFLNNEHGGEWEQVWPTAENQTDQATDSVFLFEAIHIDEDRFLHGGFRFKFESRGSQAGMIDMWHIDYVYLNKERPAPVQPSFNDRVIVSPPTPFFAPYTMVPRSQLSGLAADNFPPISFELATLNSFPFPVFFRHRVIELDSADHDHSFGTEVYNDYTDSNLPLSPDFSKRTYAAPELSALISGYADASETVYLVSELHFDTNDGNFPETNQDEITYLDEVPYNYRLNDTTWTLVEIGDVLAYDDGSAELAAGINKSRGKIAWRFDVPVSDTLTHIDMHFPSIGSSVSINRFTLSIANDLEGSMRSTSEFSKGFVSNNLNYFESFELNRPIIVEGAFYVIFEQYVNEFFPIGLDVNTNNSDKVYYLLEEEWQSDTTLYGTFMVRPRFGSGAFLTNIKDTQMHNISIYPNPADGHVNVSSPFESVAVYSLSGQLVLQSSLQKISTAHLSDGLYLVKLKLDGGIHTLKLNVKH